MPCSRGERGAGYEFRTACSWCATGLGGWDRVRVSFLSGWVGGVCGVGESPDAGDCDGAAGNKLGDDGARALASGVERNVSLRRLELGHNDIGDEGAGQLAMGLSHNLSLETVDLTGNKMVRPATLTQHSTLMAILVSARALAQPRCGASTSRVPPSRPARNVQDQAETGRMRLMGRACCIWMQGVFGAARLALALEKNTSIQALHLSSNDVRDDGAVKLADALQTSTSLQSLHLQRNHIGPDGMGRLAGALCGNSTLTLLNLGWNAILDAGARPLARAVAANTTLQTLNISGNRINPYGAERLAGAVATNESMTNLNVAYNNFSHPGTKAMAEALSKNKALRSLNLTLNQVGQSGTEHLAKMLKTNNTLRVLNIQRARPRLFGSLYQLACLVWALTGSGGHGAAGAGAGHSQPGGRCWGVGAGGGAAGEHDAGGADSAWKQHLR